MTLKASLVAKVVTKLDNGNLKIGTAYPIRADMVVTSYHVIPDINNYQKTEIKWLHPELTSPIKSILFESAENDVVVLECETPENTPFSEVCRYPPSSIEHWDSVGFPDAGIDVLKEVRKKTPAGGSYIFQSDESCEMHLEVGSDAAETSLWRGMSGAPVFTVGTNQLTGVICRVPNNEHPDFHNRIYATSMAELLKTSPKFREVVAVGVECDKHIEKHRRALLDEIEEIKNSSVSFFTSLAKAFGQDLSITPKTLCQNMVETYANDSAQSVEKLRLACEPFMMVMGEQCELLLLYLLATRSPDDTWSGDSYHNLSVRTRMLCELKLATRYQVTPKLVKIGKGDIAGQHAVHDHCQKEIGFDSEKNARHQAKSIAHYIYRQADDEYGIEEMESEDWRALNNELTSRRKGQHPELIRFELNARRDSEHPLASEDVRHELYKLLPTLPIAIFGLQSEADEKILRTMVKVFYERLEQLGNKP